MSVWQWLYDIIFRFANEHLPLADFDGDKFSAGYSFPHFIYLITFN